MTTKRTRMTLPETHLCRQGSAKGAFSPLKLKDVADYLRRVEKLQAPIDLEEPLRDLVVTFDTGVMVGTWKRDITKVVEGKREVLWKAGHPLRFTTHGAGQIAQKVLPSRFWPGFKQLVRINPKRANGVWSDFAALCGKRVLVRTARRKVGAGSVVRAIRSCHSLKYAVYSNLALVEDFMQHSHLQGLPVVSWSLSTATMHVKFSAVDEDLLGMAKLMNSGLENQCIATVDAWNSETAKKSVVLVGGVYRLVSATGLPAWSDRAYARWEHRGTTAKLSQKITQAWQGIQQGAAEVQDAYDEALDIKIPDCKKYLQKWLEENDGSEVLARQAIECLKDPTATPASTLARCVDALALAAQKGTSLSRQFEIEKMASTMLRDGVAKAEAEARMDEVMAATTIAFGQASG